MVNHQGDALRLGMNWTEEDLAKPQVLVDSADGMGHPGTFHFHALVQEVSNGVYEAGGKPGVFTVSDICDGVVQATKGMSYSLVSRDIMAAMVEIHALGHPHDGMVLISGNDKSVPAHLVAMARCDLPSIHLPGGTQLNGPDYVTSDKMWAMGARRNLALAGWLPDPPAARQRGRAAVLRRDRPGRRRPGRRVRHARHRP
jgi:dihydroxy-acid dehydratase